ncbi:unnamed protein product [Discula destructiva]
MASNRKYTDEEIDYVHARLLASWDHDMIAKAFKRDFATHWADKTFTKKQIQYIKTSYKRAPGAIVPYNGPKPDLNPSPSVSLAEFLTMDHGEAEQSVTGGHANSHIAQTYQAPADTSSEFMNTDQSVSGGRANGHTAQTSQAPSNPSSAFMNNGYKGQYMNEDNTTFTSSDALNFLDSSINAGHENNVGGTRATIETDDSLIDPTLGGIKAGDHSDDSNLDINVGTQAQQSIDLNGVGAQFDSGFEQNWPQSFSADETYYEADQYHGADNGEAGLQYSGYGAQLEEHPATAMSSLQESLLNSGGITSSEQPPSSGPIDNNPITFDTALGFSSLSVPPGCTLERMTLWDPRGWWYTQPHDGWCFLAHEHRHDYDGAISFGNVDAVERSLWASFNALLEPRGLAFDPEVGEIVQRREEEEEEQQEQEQGGRNEIYLT